MASQLRSVGLVVVLLAASLSSIFAATLLPPGTRTTFVVPKGTSYYLAGTYTFTTLTVNGTLTCGNGALPAPSISLTALNINVFGALTCGTVAVPYTGSVVITMSSPGTQGTKVIDVTGNISLVGKPRNSWTSINSTAFWGDTSFTTAIPVDWKAGERLVVTSSSFDMMEAEEVVIASVAPSGTGGSLITTTTPFENTHYGDLQRYSSPNGQSWTLDERAQVALLDRNIVFQGDARTDTNGMGAIITIRNGGQGWAQDVKFFRVGQLGRLGTYPWHWHMLGDRKGNFIKNCVIMKSGNRCVTVHGTDSVLVERNVCYDNIGHAFFVEDGCEENNAFKYNLGLTTRKPASIAAGAIDTDFTHLSTFWITNPKNYFIGNVAAGSEFAGYWFMLPSSPTRECITEPAAAKRKPGLAPNKQPLLQFDDNMAHSNFVGVGIEGGIVNSARAPTSGQATFWDPPVFPTMRNLTINKNLQGQKSLWVTMFKTIYFDNCKLADNGGSTLFSGAQITRNTLFVGESLNIYPGRRGSTTMGFAIYDGPAGMVNTHFAGFPQWFQFPLPLTGAAIKSWNFFMNNVTFDQTTVFRELHKGVPFPNSVQLKNIQLRNANFSNAQFFCQGMIDQTGSLTNQTNTILMARLNNSAANFDSARSKMEPDFNVLPSCTFNTYLGFYVCPGTMKWVTAVIFHRFTKPGQIIDVKRSDRTTYTSIDNSGRPHYFFNALIVPGLSYNVTYRNKDSLLWSADATPQSFQMYLMNADFGQAVDFTLSNMPIARGKWKWAVTECYTHRILVPPTAASSFTFTLKANITLGSIPGPYPNQKVGGVRVNICAITPSAPKCNC